ncbi:hypothetical protein GLYMA_05G247433v4 [Glycine max]|nr:hypothetical protein GLYMA_05G247433v4 [Glycine max]KAH1079889.1 hypothetical protein GYH30_057023 [Glycine max]
MWMKLLTNSMSMHLLWLSRLQPKSLVWFRK